jgi:ribA/ribD-fused uncharacterized protein
MREEHCCDVCRSGTPCKHPWHTTPQVLDHRLVGRALTQMPASVEESIATVRYHCGFLQPPVDADLACLHDKLYEQQLAELEADDPFDVFDVDYHAFPEHTPWDVLFFYARRADKEYHCLSPYSASEFTDERGQGYWGAEQFKMAGKARAMGDDDSLRCILASEYDPANVKFLGRRIRPFDQERWDAVRLDIVTFGNYLKFTQNEQDQKTLMATGDRTLVYAAPLDNVWGIGLTPDDAQACYPWRGLNLLGIALVRVREALRVGNAILPPSFGEHGPHPAEHDMPKRKPFLKRTRGRYIE